MDARPVTAANLMEVPRMRRPEPTFIICKSEQRADTRWIAAVLIASVTNKDCSVVAAACVRRAGRERSEVRGPRTAAKTTSLSPLDLPQPTIR